MKLGPKEVGSQLREDTGVLHGNVTAIRAAGSAVLERCFRCGQDTEWDRRLGNKALCTCCWDRAIDAAFSAGGRNQGASAAWRGYESRLRRLYAADRENVDRENTV